MDQSDYVSIGRRFPSLHPVLIGEYGTLSNIKDVIGEEAELLEISQGPKFRLGTLYVRSEVVDSPETRRRLVSWLAAAPELAPFAGEYEIRGAKILSLRRSRELESAGVLSKLPEGFVRYLLVSAAHCAMIGVDPEDMITYIGPASQVMKAQAAADREFFRTDRSLPVRDRVWLAYDATSFKNVAAELKVLLKRVYFGR